MENKRRNTGSPLGTEIDIYTIVRDVCRNWWFVLAIAISVALFSYVSANKKYSPTYTVEATYAITSKGVNNTVYDNLAKTQDTAVKLSEILNSSTLKGKVAEDLGLGGIPGNVWAEVVPETNLLTLRVRAASPEMSYKILNSVMRIYPQISDYILGDTVMDVLMEPVIPTEPDQLPAVASTVIKSFAVTVVLLVAALVVLSYMKDTIRKRSDVEQKLDVRLLGTITHEEKNKTILSKIQKRNQSLLITNPILSFGYVEKMQKTCCKVQDRLDEINGKTLMVTSCMENEGKSTIAANLALAFVRSGKKAVLVDLDCRKPSQYKIFGWETEVGAELEKVLRGKREMSEDVITSLDNGLSVVFNTKRYANSTEILSSGNLEKILAYLKERFDYVIIDTPPMAFVADTEEIAYMTDASLVVVREHTANARNINDMLDALGNCSAKVIGCVFNDAHTRFGRFLVERTGYGYGYGYGQYYERKID